MEEQGWLLLSVFSARVSLDDSRTICFTIPSSQFGVTNKREGPLCPCPEGPVCPTLLTINKGDQDPVAHAEQAAPWAGGWRGKARRCSLAGTCRVSRY